jgi:hypothetical protein
VAKNNKHTKYNRKMNIRENPSRQGILTHDNLKFFEKCFNQKSNKNEKWNQKMFKIYYD